MASQGAIRLNVDATGARRGAEEARKALAGVGKAARASAQVLEQMADAVDAAGDESKDAAKEIDKLKKAEDEAAKAAKGMKRAISKVVAALGGMLIIYEVVNSLKKFEDGLVGVGKTTNILGPDLASMGQDILGLSRDLRTGTDELLEIAQTAGQLGVSGKAGILAFTETMAMLGQASNLVGEEGATKLARMLNIAGEAPETVGALAAVIVELGNNFAATEKEIAHSGTQVALATAAFGVSSAEAAALGAVLASLGVRAETGGSSVARVFRVIDKAVRGGAEEMAALEKITGKTAKELSTTFRRSSVEGFQVFIDGLGEVAEKGGDTTAALASLGLSGEEILKVMPTMALNSDLLGESFARMSDQLANGNALLDENARAMDTFGAEVDRLGNAYAAVKLSMLGTSGALKASTGFFADVLFAMSGVKDEANGVNTAAEYMAVTLKVVMGLGVAAGFTAIASAVATYGVAAKIAAHATILWNAALALNPVVLIAAAVIGVATAFALLASDIDEATEAIKENNAEMQEFEGFLDRLGKSRAAEVVAARAEDFSAQIAAIKAQQQLYNDQLVRIEEGAIKERSGIGKPQLLERLEPKPVTEVAEMLGMSERAVSDAVFLSLTSGLNEGITKATTDAEVRANIENLLGDQFRNLPAEEAARGKRRRAAQEESTRPALIHGSTSGLWGRRVSEDPDRHTDPAIFDRPTSGLWGKRVSEEGRAQDTGVAAFAAEFAATAVTGEQQRQLLEEAIKASTAEIEALTTAWDASKQAATDAANAPTEAMLKGVDALEKYREELEETEEAMNRILAGTSTSKEEAAESQIVSQLADARAKIQETLKEGAVVDEKDLKPLEAKLRLLADLAAQIAAKKTQDDFTLSVEKQTAALVAENEVRRSGSDSLAIDLQLKKLELELIDKEVTNRDELLAALRAELMEKQRLADEDRKTATDNAAAAASAKQAQAIRERGAQTVKDMATALDLERQTLGKNNFERQRFTDLLQLEQALRAAGVSNTTAALEAYEDEVRQLQEMAFYEEMAASMSDAFGVAFTDIITGTATAEEAFAAMFESIGRMMLEKLVTEPLVEQLTEYLASNLPDLSELLGGVLDVPGETIGDSQVEDAQVEAAKQAAQLATNAAVTSANTLTTAGTTSGTAILDGCIAGAAAITKAAGILAAAATAAKTASAATPSAKGNVFSGGSLVPFAYGGVVSHKTTFPMADGRIGLMGEAGPEAIMPLERGVDGKLGVRGSGPQTVNNVTNVSMNVRATDADSFRKSRRQISADLRKI